MTDEQIMRAAMDANLGVTGVGTTWIGFMAHKEWLLKFARAILAAAPVAAQEPPVLSMSMFASRADLEAARAAQMAAAPVAAQEPAWTPDQVAQVHREADAMRAKFRPGREADAPAAIDGAPQGAGQ